MQINVQQPVPAAQRTTAASPPDSEPDNGTPEAERPTSKAGHPRVRALLLVLLALLIALAMSMVSYRLFTAHNDFPLSYHPDEWSKVDQIASHTQVRNFNHPVLLLETANLLREYRGISIRADDRDLAIIGRCASALLASIGVFGFAMAGFVGYRFVGLFIVGCSAMLCPWLLVFAHYLKEDAALIGGIGVAFLGAALTTQARCAWTQLAAVVVLGIGTAMAASGKYVGAAAIVPALLALILAPVARWWMVPSRLILFLIAVVVVFVSINARAFEDPWTLTLKPYAPIAFREEFEHGTTEHMGVRLLSPNIYCLRIAANHWQWHVWGFALIWLGAAAWQLRRRQVGISRFGVVLTSFLVTFVGVLSFNAIPIQRYGLPIAVLGFVLSAMAISAVIWRTEGARKRIVFASLALVPIVFLQLRTCLAYNAQFADDSRERLSQWIALSVPAGTRIVADRFASLDRTGDRWRFPDRKRYSAIVSSRGFAFNSGSLPDLARRGVKYVVTAEPDYQRFFAPGATAAEGDEDYFDYAKAWYTELFERGTLVWSSSPSPPSDAYVDPELRVYDITAFKDAASEREPRRGWFNRVFR